MNFILRKLHIETFLVGITWLSCTFAQAPEIASGGIVNAASWSSPVTPGAMISIFGTNLAAGELSATAPLPYTLGGTSVAINGVSSPLSFVSPTQINAQVPSSLQTTNGTVAAVSVVVTNSSGSSVPAQAGLAAGNPGIFSSDGSGCGPAAALNITPFTASLNSPSNSAAPGGYVTLFGTGFGLAAQQPPDGVAATNPSALQIVPGLFIDSTPVSGLQYAGLAPETVGVDQINFQIPASTRNGCSVPVSASQTLGSPRVTLSVQSGRGRCTDPPIESWGQLTLNKAVFSGPGILIPAIESFTALFPSGPGLQPPAPEEIVFAPNYVANVVPSVTIAILSAVPIVVRACPVPGYSNLSAGAIQVQAPSGAKVTAQPLPLPAGGVTYSQSLPDGFIGSGAYAISGTQGSAVELMSNLVVGSPIQLQTALPPGLVISSSQPLVVKWTGGDPGTLVKVTLTSGQGLAARSDYSYADATTGSLSISPLCNGNPVSAGGNGILCSFGLPISPNAQITVQVLPAPDQVTTITVPGVTGAVRLNWQYSYNFSGLELGQ